MNWAEILPERSTKASWLETAPFSIKSSLKYSLLAARTDLWALYSSPSMSSVTSQNWLASLCRFNWSSTAWPCLWEDCFTMPLLSTWRKRVEQILKIQEVCILTSCVKLGHVFWDSAVDGLSGYWWPIPRIGHQQQISEGPTPNPPWLKKQRRSNECPFRAAQGGGAASLNPTNLILLNIKVPENPLIYCSVKGVKNREHRPSKQDKMMARTKTSSCFATGFFLEGFGSAFAPDAELLSSSSVSLLSERTSSPNSSSISEGSLEERERSTFSWHLLHFLM